MVLFLIEQAIFGDASVSNEQLSIFPQSEKYGGEHFIALPREETVQRLQKLANLSDLQQIKNALLEMKTAGEEQSTLPSPDQSPLNGISPESDTIYIKKKYWTNELNQLIKTHTLERTQYYLRRLVKSLTEVKTNRINDLNLNRWKEYDHIITDSLWILPKRDTSGAHLGWYWGNYVPQIPHQFLLRFTKKGDWVLDPFLGSGTTLIECRRTGRNGIGVELQEKIARAAETLIEREPNRFAVQTPVITADSSQLDFSAELQKRGLKSMQFLIMHPPYWDIIKFSDDRQDLSNAATLEEFLSLLGQVVDHTYPVLDTGRYFALVIGDKYERGEWIPLGFYSMQEVLKRGYQLKSIVVKNFDQTRGKMNQKELWRYRALVGGFYVFKHEYIFLFKKVK